MNDTSQNKTGNLIDNHLGRVFPTPALIGGYLFLTMGIIGLLSGYIIGLVVALVGAFVCFTFRGYKLISAKKQ